VRRLRVLLLAVLVLPIHIVLTARPAAARPDVAARNWIVMDGASGDVLDAQEPHQRTAIASLTKMLTALVAVERADLEQVVTVMRSDLIRGSSARLREGERLSLRTLLYGLLLPSGNDAALAIARAVGGSPHADDQAARGRFIDWMNERAVSLGLTDTRVVNPHGLDARDHFGSAHDLALVTRAVLESPVLAPIFGAHDYSGEGHRYESTNKLWERYPGIIGGKTGWTRAAGHCLVEVAERDGRRVIVVLLGSTSERWYDDATALLDHGFAILSPPATPEPTGHAHTTGLGGTAHAPRSWTWSLAPGAFAESPTRRWAAWSLTTRLR